MPNMQDRSTKALNIELTLNTDHRRQIRTCSLNLARTIKKIVQRSETRLRVSYNITFKWPDTIQNHSTYKEPQKSDQSYGKENQQTSVPRWLRCWKYLTKTFHPLSFLFKKKKRYNWYVKY